MEHFAIIKALCRAAIAHPTPALRKQIERLRDALAEDGEKKQAISLERILTAADRPKEIAPSRIVRSKIPMAGEILSPDIHLPVDRETSTPLAEVIFPSDIQEEPPLFDKDVFQAIETIIEEWANSEGLQDIGVTPSNSFVIYGAPGVGKTRLAFWIARQLGLPVLLIKLDGLVSSFLGTTARNIGNLFTFANRYRCVLLLDEFDAIAKIRDDQQEIGEIKRVVNALLQNLDGRRNIGLTIGITNHSKLLDPAVWRRFEIQIEIPKPDFGVRKALAAYFMLPVEVPDSYLRLIAWFTEEATGAEIEALVQTYKKDSIIRKSDGNTLQDTLRRFAILNAARIGDCRRDLLHGDSRRFLRMMHEDSDLELSYEEIGKIVGRDKSSISRRLNQLNRNPQKN